MIGWLRFTSVVCPVLTLSEDLTAFLAGHYRVPFNAKRCCSNWSLGLVAVPLSGSPIGPIIGGLPTPENAVL